MHPLYDVSRRAYFIIPPLCLPLQFFVDAPFGRFTPSTDSVFLVDGIRAWIVMELAAPLTFVYALVHMPLAVTPADVATLTPASTLLAALFLVHYANRALLCPLRTPSRSKAHVIVTLCGIVFNLINGTLIGTYLGSPTTSAFLGVGAFSRPAFWVGITLWVAGFAGNIIHDEILLNIRRNARAKGKARARPPSPCQSVSASPSRKQQREHYGIPHGYLYAYVSYPNYLCEWIEWTGFALAAAPIPDTSSLNALVATIQPPWIFLLAEFCLMVGRAYNGHQWYLRNLSDYPKDRKVVIPYIF